MTALFFSAFITLFVVIDPPGCAPIYAGLTKGATAAERRNMAIRASGIALVILLVFALFGEDLLGALHIELDSFRIAGGIMLFLIALEMVFEKRTERREHRAEEHLGTHSADPEPDDISVFPLGIPMVAGPGSKKYRRYDGRFDSPRLPRKLSGRSWASKRFSRGPRVAVFSHSCRT